MVVLTQNLSSQNDNEGADEPLSPAPAHSQRQATSSRANVDIKEERSDGFRPRKRACPSPKIFIRIAQIYNFLVRLQYCPFLLLSRRYAEIITILSDSDSMGHSDCEGTDDHPQNDEQNQDKYANQYSCLC